MDTTAYLVFHNPKWCDGPEVSPMVGNRWNRPVVELLLESRAHFSTNDVHLACARFIGWCYSQPGVDTFQMSVSNVPERPDPEGAEDQAAWSERLTSWYQRLIRRLGSWELAVLVNMATLEVTQNGVVLWRPEPRLDQHLIWRPNEIAPEDWEAMTREEQVNWWQTRSVPAGPKGHMKEAVGIYHEGNITDTDFVCLVFQLAAPEEIEEFVRVCPPDLLALVQDALATYRDDEATWPRTFRMTSYFPWVTAEKIEESNRREQEQIWHGVRLLKGYFSRG